jgi:hypothetical protein
VLFTLHPSLGAVNRAKAREEKSPTTPTPPQLR